MTFYFCNRLELISNRRRSYKKKKHDKQLPTKLYSTATQCEPMRRFICMHLFRAVIIHCCDMTLYLEMCFCSEQWDVNNIEPIIGFYLSEVGLRCS